MKKTQAFTLIELIIVIIILGILAVTAAPKFMDINGDAKASVMQEVQGSVKSAMVGAHAKALIAGKTAATGEIKIDGTYYALVYGYPAAANVGTGTAGTTGNGYGIEGLIEIDGDISFANKIFSHDGATDSTNCIVTYTEATSATAKATAVLEKSGC